MFSADHSSPSFYREVEAGGASTPLLFTTFKTKSASLAGSSFGYMSRTKNCTKQRRV